MTLTRSILVLFLFFLIICALYFAKPFLIPVAFAGIFAMLLLPLTKRLEGKGVKSGLAVLLSILALVVGFAGILLLLGWQVADLSKDLSQAEGKIMNAVGKLRQTISNSLGISPEKQNQLIKEQQSSGGGGGGAASAVTAIMNSIMGAVVNFVLVLVYIFLFLLFRTHLKKFILKLVPEQEKGNTQKIIDRSQKVAFNYVSGLGMMIVILWIMYAIGFSIAGVKHAIFFAILCGMLEIIPFVGNITGTALTLLMALTQGGGSNVVIGILITYGIVQFIQTYILEPLVVGSEVNINPLFTIMVIVAGELIWGIPGMILSIPILGIIKVLCDNIPALQPYGFLIGEDKKKENKENWFDKIKKRFSKS